MSYDRNMIFMKTGNDEVDEIFDANKYHVMYLSKVEVDFSVRQITMGNQMLKHIKISRNES